MKTILKIKISSILLISVVITGTCLAQDNQWKAPAQANELINPVNGDFKATMKGKKIYEKLCWSCHDMKGTGNGPASTALSPKPANYTSEKVQKQSDGAIYWKISNGKGQMASFDQTLSDEQRWMLVNYIRLLGNKKNL